MPYDPLPVVLITRPALQARAFAAMLGPGPVVIAPILRIVPVDHDRARIAAAKGLVFTSAHAVPAGGTGRGRPAYCVGMATADAARTAGFEVIVGGGDLEGLLPLLARADVAPLHLHGRHLTAGSDVPGLVVYDQLPQRLTQQALDLLASRAPVILPLFSARSALLLAHALAGATAPLRPVAISAAVANAWSKTRSQDADAIVIAASPDASAMRDAIIPLQSGEQS